MMMTPSLTAIFLAFILSAPAPAVLGAAATETRPDSKSPGPRSGNPVFNGWYADPEAAVFGKQYWIYPTYSAPYGQQVFFDAFSSPDLVHWTKHEHILGTNDVKWARRAMWA